MPHNSVGLALPSGVNNFDPGPYVAPLTAAVLCRPDQFLLPEGERVPIYVHARNCDDKELVKLYKRWDDIGRLHLCLPEVS